MLISVLEQKAVHVGTFSRKEKRHQILLLERVGVIFSIQILDEACMTQSNPPTCSAVVRETGN